MEIDRDGEMSVEMARTLLWEHQGIDLTGRNTLVFTAPAPSAPGKSEQGNLEVPAEEEPFGLNSWECLQAVYQSCTKRCRRSWSKTGVSSSKIPTAPTWYAPPSPSKPVSSVSRLTSWRDRGPSPTARCHGRKAASARAAAAVTAASGHAR